jgi:methyl-accepting chemotaxis protein
MTSADASVGAIAARLEDIATNVAQEASQLTTLMRSVAEHAQDVATLVAELEEVARRIDAGMREQVRFIDAVREEFSENEPAMAALASSSGIIASMSVRIREIADRSRMLSLNARIEAARNNDGRAFASVAEAMGDLAAQTRSTTSDIHDEAGQIEGNVAAAGKIIRAGTALADHQHGMIAQMAASTSEQRRVTLDLRRLTQETVEQVSDAASGIGRVASAASVAGLLSRQIGKIATAARAGAPTTEANATATVG